MAPRSKAVPAVLDEQRVVVASSTEVRLPARRKQRTTRDSVRLAQRRASASLKRTNDFLTAAAQIMEARDLPGAGMPNAVTRTWQHAVWGYGRSVPELSAARMYVGNCLSRCTLAVGKRNADGSVEQGFDGEEPVEGLDGEIATEAAEIIADIRGPRSGQSELLRSAGEKLFMVGEHYLVPEDTPAGVAFEVLSTQELLKEGSTWTRYYGPGFDPEPLPLGTQPIRVWRPDSQFSKLADSSVRACMEVLEELVVLTRLVRGSAISRMALSGILLIPDELDNPDDELDADGNVSEAKNPLAVDIINTAAKAVDDPASAAAFTPYVLQGAADYLEKVRHLAFEGDDHENVGKRLEAIQRLAHGLDLPLEVILSHQETTFSNAAVVSEDTFRIHIEPTLQLICDAFTESVLWPRMAMNRGIDAEHLKDAPLPEELLGVAVTYDAQKLVSRPDRTKDILEVYGKDLTFMTIRMSEIREALGLDPDQVPDDEEVAKRIDAYRLGRIREVIAAPASDAAVPIQDAAKAPVPGASAGGDLIGKETPSSTTAQADVAAQAAEQAAVTASGAGLNGSAPALAQRVAGAAELTVERAVERIGAKLKNALRAKAFSEVERDAVSGAPAASVPAILGREVVERGIGSTDEAMLAEIKTLSRKVERWAGEAGASDPGLVAADIAALVMETARATLYDRNAPGISVEAVQARLTGTPVGP